MTIKALLQLARATYSAVQRDDCQGLAAEMAFYLAMSLVPAAVFLCSFFGWIGQKNRLAEEFITQLQPTLPPDLALWFGDFTIRVVKSSTGDLALWSLLLTLWTASNGIGSIFKGVNRAYGLEGGRFGLFKRQIWGTIFLFCFGGFLILSSNIAIWGDILLSNLRQIIQVPEIWISIFGKLHWLLPFGGLFLFSILLYWILPKLYKLDNQQRKIGWYQTLPGSLFFVLVWTVTSQLFGLYLKEAGMFNELYSMLGTVLILLLWLYTISLGLLIGAELNAQMINSNPGERMFSV